MAGILTAAILIYLAVKILAHGEPIELDDLLGLPQLLALLAAAALPLLILLRRVSDAAAVAMLGLACSGLLLVLFPERMPDTTRGGTLLTAFWSGFGGLLILVAWTVTLLLSQPA